MLTVRQVYDFIHAIAPFDTQEDFDNSGLLVGSMDKEVTGIHVAMDVTANVLEEAIREGANLIVTHHPMMFRGRKTLTDSDREGRLLCRMIRHGICLIAAHTNLDRAPGGINDVLAQVIGLQNVTGEDFVRVGKLPCPMTAAAFGAQLEKALHTTVRLMGYEDTLVETVGVCSGSGDDYWPQAAAMGAEAFVTGETHHHVVLDAADTDMVLFECGHHATEEPGIFALADALQKWINEVQYNVRVSKSAMRAYC